MAAAVEEESQQGVRGPIGRYCEDDDGDIAVPTNMRQKERRVRLRLEETRQSGMEGATERMCGERNWM